MSHKKKPEDSHKVRDEKEEKARKEHEVAANVAETIVIGEAGNERDRIANLVPTMKAIKEVADFLHDIVEIDAKIAEKAVEAVSEEVAESIPLGVVSEDIAEKDVIEVALPTEEVQEEALPDTAITDSEESVIKVNIDTEEAEKHIEALRAEIAALEKELEDSK